MKKKLLVAVMATSAAVCGAFGFTACGDNDNTNDADKDVYAVTETEWIEALKLLTDGKNSIKCDYLEGEGGEDGKGTITFIYDRNNKAYYCKIIPYEMEMTETYAWVDGVKAFKADGKNKFDLTTDEFDNILTENYVYCTGTDVIEYADLTNKFEKFSYSDGRYSAEITVKDFPVVYNLKFENGKLVHMKSEGQAERYDIKYEYNVSYTVPENVKNLPVKEN